MSLSTLIELQQSDCSDSSDFDSPTPSQVAQRCREIRDRWSTRVIRSRAVKIRHDHVEVADLEIARKWARLLGFVSNQTRRPEIVLGE